MTLQLRLEALATVIGADIKTLSANQGNLAALSTTAKGSLVAALNEVKAIASAAGAINDAAANNSTTETYSANKITAVVNTAITQVIGGASAAYDTLVEIQAILQGDGTSIANLLTAVGNRVRFDAAQTLTAPQILQACQNIGIGNPDSDLVSVYTTAKT